MIATGNKTSNPSKDKTDLQPIQIQNLNSQPTNQIHMVANTRVGWSDTMHYNTFPSDGEEDR